jgi:hypothetical protein
MRSPFIVFLCGLSLCLNLQAGEQSRREIPAVAPGKRLLIPVQITALVAERFPQLQIPTEENYRSHRTQDSLDAVALGHGDSIYYVADWFNYAEHEVPWCCWGDFNGDRLTDVALILIPKGAVAYQDTLNGVGPQFVVFHQTKTGYDIILPWPKFPSSWSAYALLTFPPGAIPPLPTAGGYREETVWTQYDTISWINDSASSCRFSWNGEEYIQIWTGD